MGPRLPGLLAVCLSTLLLVADVRAEDEMIAARSNTRRFLDNVEALPATALGTMIIVSQVTSGMEDQKLPAVTTTITIKKVKNDRTGLDEYTLTSHSSLRMGGGRVVTDVTCRVKPSLYPLYYKSTESTLGTKTSFETRSEMVLKDRFLHLTWSTEGTAQDKQQRKSKYFNSQTSFPGIVGLLLIIHMATYKATLKQPLGVSYIAARGTRKHMILRRIGPKSIDHMVRDPKTGKKVERSVMCEMVELKPYIKSGTGGKTPPPQVVFYVDKQGRILRQEKVRVHLGRTMRSVAVTTKFGPSQPEKK